MGKCFPFKFDSFMRERDRHGIIGISQAIGTGNQHNGIATAAAAEGQIALGSAGYVGVRGYLALAAPLSSHHNGHGQHQHRNRSRGAGGAAGNNNGASAGGTGAITSPPTPNNRQTTPPAGRSHSAVASPSGPIGAATATAVVNGNQANMVNGNEKKPLSNGLTSSECATNNVDNREGTTSQPSVPSSAANGSPQQPAPTTASTFAENE